MATDSLPFGHGLRDTIWGDYSDDEGNNSGYYFDRPYYADLISQGIDVFGGRGRTNRQQPYGNYPQQYQQQYGQVSPGGLNTSGVQINWWVVGGVLAAVLLFQAGKRR